jgi:hypothetical protein
MLRPEVGIKFLTIVLLTVFTAFAQSSDRLPVTDEEKIADAMRRRACIHHKGRCCARLALETWRRVPNPSKGIERVDLSPGCSTVSARRARLLRRCLLAVDAG